MSDDKHRTNAEADSPVSNGRWAWEWIKSFLIAFGLFLVIRSFVVEAFRIPTGSMENTLLVGDFLLVNKAVFGASIPGAAARLPALAEPRRGDVVVFVPPHEAGKNYVKRLVGMPGDTLAMVGKTLYLNGILQDEPAVRHSDPHDIVAPGMVWQCELAGLPAGRDACRPTRDNWGPIVVPDGHYFMLGDNRDDSEDSRYWGFVPRAALKGRPLFIYYSFESASPRAVPWLTGIRWDRVGRGVH
ncbi:MAG TPA: signal peptidase I [Longimicrobiales bacterium]|nr:signal peptidase I [Longimicrobiales bacterium]